MDFTPRQIQILFLLLNAEGPLNSIQLAEGLNTSKRTVFREMNYVDRNLEELGLTLERKARKGFTLHGSEEARQKLMCMLQGSDSFDPKNREDRQKKLLYSILREDDVQKIYYYVDKLQVSESTISNDLADISGWLNRYGVRLLKRPDMVCALHIRRKIIEGHS